VVLDCSLAILAGGMSSRFDGSDKQTASLHGTPLGRRVALNALSLGVPVILVGPQHDIYEDLPLRFVHDLIPGFGPLSGLHAALFGASSSWVFLLACDMPYFNRDWVYYLNELAQKPVTGDSPATLAVLAQKGSYIEPFQGLYSRLLIPELEQKMNRAGAAGIRLSFSRLLDGLPHRIVPEATARRFSPGWNLFKSINDKPALREYLRDQNGKTL